MTCELIFECPGLLSAQDWRTFLQNHSKEVISLDFFTVPTAGFKILFVLVILSNDRRRILHFNATDHPTAAWTGQQLVEACGMDEKPKYLLRDRDAIYGKQFSQRAQTLGIEEALTAYRSPWQNASSVLFVASASTMSSFLAPDTCSQS